MFEQAAARWEEVIVGDLPAVWVRQPTPFECQRLTVPALDEGIDDLLVFVEIGPLDGPSEGLGGGGSIVGSGGPCVLRDSFLPAVSAITLDEEDQSWFGEHIVLHELGHALGFDPGVWVPLGLLKDPSDPANGRPGPLEAVADATVSEWEADGRFGLPDGTPLSEHLVVGEGLGTWTDGPGSDELMVLLRFKVEGVLSAPPLGAVLQLTPTATAGDPSPVAFHGLTAPWEEGTVRWGSMPAFGPRLGSYSNSGFVTSRCTPTCEADLTEVVAAWVLGDPNFGIVARQQDFFDGLLANVSFHTRHAADPAVRPQLRFHVDTHFAGPAARAAFAEAGGTGYQLAKVPVEIGFSPDRVGVVDTHWREVVFAGELMSSGGGTVLSAVTIGAMADIGYEVDPGAADPFTIWIPENSQIQPELASAPPDRVASRPVYRVTTGGGLQMIGPAISIGGGGADRNGN